MGWPTPPPRRGWCSTRTPEQCRWDFVNAWLGRADEDVTAARLILAGDMHTYNLVGFHAQQAAEKALKALLVRHGVRVDRTHDLGALLAQAEAVALGIADALGAAEELTAHAVASRCPGEEPPLDRDEASARLDLARVVVSHVRERLGAYLEGGRPADA